MANGPLRGVFTIPVTPFDDRGVLDETSLRKVVDFCIEASAHGIVSPVNASEFSSLSDEERRSVARIVVEQAAKRAPVVVGVSGVSVEVAVAFAKHARSIGADAVIAMPPYIRKPNMDYVFGYYEQIANAAELPVFIQNYMPPIGLPMSAELMVKMSQEIEHVKYIKEETVPVTHIITKVLSLADGRLEGVFGGAAGRHMMDEMRRGSCGTMPACDVTDIHVAIWKAYQSGKIQKAREIFNRLLPLLNMEFQFGVLIYKEILKRRGIIRSAYVRTPSIPCLDEYDHLELDEILRDIEPLFALR